ncbi:hypothetical protein D1007_06881 [Hordeum vulgare]|nr:hypothetical protein D1007_06881 [Hordeum vulgare]
MPRKHLRDGNAAYDTGSSLYDSYELASLNRILERHLAVAGPPSPDEGPPVEGKDQQVVAFRARRKVLHTTDLETQVVSAGGTLQHGVAVYRQ